jgi:Fumarylacetoacetate (FAA) hydrolase family
MTADATMWTRLSRTQNAGSVRIPKLDEGPMRAAALTLVLRDRAGQSGRDRCKWDEVADMRRAPGLERESQLGRLRNHEVDIVDLRRLASRSWCGCVPSGGLDRLSAALSWVVAVVSGKAQDAVWRDTPEAVDSLGIAPPNNARPGGDDFTLKGRSDSARNCDNASGLLLGATVVLRLMIHQVTGWIASLSTAFTQEPSDASVTGTPSGVGMVMDPQTFLKVGAVVRAQIEGLGAFANRLAGRAV